MKNPRDNQPPFPVRDYSLALRSAVSWLGERYLLATPIHAAGQPGRARRATARLSVKLQ